VRLATWNVNGLRARIDFVLAWLKDRQPDVVGLQELKLTDDQFPHDVFEAAGYKAATHGQKSWNGVAILSRQPIENCSRGLPGEDEIGSRLITADVGGINFTTVYVPNGKSIEHDDYQKKLIWLESLRRHLENQFDPDKPTVLCGDFNICPASIDCWAPAEHEGKIFHTEPERQRLGSILEWGFQDVFRERFPDAKEFSWWDYRGGAFHRKMGLRIDFLLATASALSRVTNVEIDREYRKKQDGLTASDHAPVIIDLD
jgi:exodeoxyribonuclease-3